MTQTKLRKASTRRVWEVPHELMLRWYILTRRARSAAKEHEHQKLHRDLDDLLEELKSTLEPETSRTSQEA